MSREWQVGDIVELQSKSDLRDGDATQMTAMVSAVQVNSWNDRDTVRWVYLGPWFEYKTQKQHEELGWRLVEPKVLIPPGTQTHRFTDIPDDDLLTPREGHPYT